MEALCAAVGSIVRNDYIHEDSAGNTWCTNGGCEYTGKRCERGGRWLKYCCSIPLCCFFGTRIQMSGQGQNIWVLGLYSLIGRHVCFTAPKDFFTHLFKDSSFGKGANVSLDFLSTH